MLIAFSALRIAEKAKEFSTGRIKRALLFLRAMVDQRPTLFIEHLEQKFCSSKLSQLGRFVHVTDQLSPQHPQVVDVLADRLAG